MKNKLFLLCDDMLQKADWILLGEKDKVIDEGKSTSLVDLKNQINLTLCKTVVFIASHHVAIKNVDLPKSYQRIKLEKLIPNMLEEELVSDLTELNFTYVNDASNKRVHVAIVDKEVMNDWSKKLAVFDSNIKEIYPLCLALKIKEGSWHLYLKENMATVRLNPYFGFTLEIESLPQILDYYVEKEKKPSEIIISGDLSKLQIIQEKLTDFSALIKTHNNDSLLSTIEYKINNINLLRNKFLHFKDERNTKMIAYHVSALTVLAILFFIGTQMMRVKYLEKANETLNQEITALYKTFYPNATAVTSPKARIEQDLKSFSLDTKETFYDLLLVTGKALAENQNVNLKNISYKEKTLIINLEASDYSVIEKLVQTIKNNHLNVKQNQVQGQKDKIVAVLTISGNN